MMPGQTNRQGTCLFSGLKVVQPPEGLDAAAVKTDVYYRSFICLCGCYHCADKYIVATQHNREARVATREWAGAGREWREETLVDSGGRRTACRERGLKAGLRPAPPSRSASLRTSCRDISRYRGDVADQGRERLAHLRIADRAEVVQQIEAFLDQEAVFRGLS